MFQLPMKTKITNWISTSTEDELTKMRYSPLQLFAEFLPQTVKITIFLTKSTKKSAKRLTQSYRKLEQSSREANLEQY